MFPIRCDKQKLEKSAIKVLSQLPTQLFWEPGYRRMPNDLEFILFNMQFNCKFRPHQIALNDIRLNRVNMPDIFTRAS